MQDVEKKSQNKPHVRKPHADIDNRAVEYTSYNERGFERAPATYPMRM